MKSLPLTLGALAASFLLALPSTADAQGRQQGPQRTLPESWVEHLDWRSVGPANMGGRVTSITVHPTDSNTYWIGMATGGVLKTTNRGVTYTHQFDQESTASVGDIAVAPSNPEVLYLGSGESNPRNSVSWGHGVFKSTDGGTTWKNVGLEETFQIGVVEVHPEDENVVYVGALGRLWGENEQRGLFKSTDGGETWEKVLYVNEMTGVIDMRLDPQDPDTLVVATYERKRDGFDTNDPAKKWGEGSALYKSSDGGATWKKLTEGLPSGKLGRIGLDFSKSEPGVVYAIVESDRITQEPENAAWMGLRGESAEVGARITSVEKDSPAAEAGLQEGDIVLLMDGKTVHSWGDMQAAIRRHVADETIAVVASRNRERVEVDVTFRRQPSEEEDGGGGARGGNRGGGAGESEEAELHEIPEPGPFHLGLGGQVANVQDQQGEDGHEYGGLYRSDNSGDTWTRVNSINPRPMYYSRVYVDPSDGNYIYVLGTQLHKSSDRGETFTPDGHDNEVHVDHHNMWIDPNDGRHMILGNDGGIYVTYDRMDEWDHHNHMALGQFYQVESDNTRNYKVYGGLQDNGSWGGPNRVDNNRGPVNSDWFRIGGGDGFVVRVDPQDPDQIYGESQNGYTFRVNLATGEQRSIRARPPRGERYRFNWNTPFILSPHNSKIYYSAGNHVFRSPMMGDNIQAISPEITRTDRGAATALHESPAREGVIYVGTDDGALWMTQDGGHTWVDLYNLPVEEEEEAAAEGEAEPSAEDDGAVEASEPTTDSPLNGSWDGSIEAEEIPEGEGKFTMHLKVDEQNRISGTMVTDFGDSSISDGSFNQEDNTLRFRFSNDMMAGIVTGKMEANGMTGEIDAGPGMMQFDFSAARKVAEERPARARAQAGGDAGGAVRGQGGGRGNFEGRDIDSLPPEMQERIRQRQAQGGGNFGGRTGGGQGRGARGAAMQEAETPGLEELVPGRFHVSSIQASHHSAGRVFVTFDGHRSNDDLPHIVMSDDFGRTWTSLRGDLPDSAGSARVITEDFENPNVLFLGTEFGAWVSIDRGNSWTRMNNDDLPTVPVHDFKLHPLTGELIAGTHGRSIWITDVSTLRQLSEESMSEEAVLYQPEEVQLQRRGFEAGSSGTRRFVGENPPSGTRIRYSLGNRARSVKLWVTDINGEDVYEFETETQPGLHEVQWDLRRASENNRRWGRPIPAGQYLIQLRVDGVTQHKVLEVLPAD